MTIQQALFEASAKLLDASIPSSHLDAALLLGHVCGYSKEQLITQNDEELSPSAEAKFRKAIEKRLRGCPVSRIIGYREFYGLNFRITQDVLDPRPETEMLVDLCFQYSVIYEYPARVLDIGTGSGCIPVTLARKSAPGAFQLTATDISVKALDTAKINATAHDVIDQIRFIVSDIFDNLEAISESPFNIIVSNPPYIPTGDIVNLDTEVRGYDPIESLDGGIDGLDIIRKIISRAPDFLSYGGRLLIEIGSGQKEAVLRIPTSLHFEQFHPDLAGIDRVVEYIKY